MEENACPEDDVAYRAMVQERLQQVMKMLARISFGGTGPVLDISKLPVDDFSEILCGLQLLQDDFALFRNEIEDQSRFNQLRGEIWKAATSAYLTRDDLILGLLRTIGSRIDVRRASYYRIDRKKNHFSIDIQWTAAGIDSTVGLVFPLAGMDPSLGSECIEISMATIGAGPFAHLRDAFLRTGTGSILAVRNGSAGNPFGFFAFSVAETDRVWTTFEKNILLEMAAIVTAKLSQIKAEDELRLANIELEQEVEKRTAELGRINRELQIDIDERKRIETALRESEETYRRLVETSPDAIIATDLSGLILMANQAAVLMSGSENRHDLTGRNAFDLVAPAYRERYSHDMNRTLTENGIKNVQYLFLKRNGSTFDGECNATVIRDGAGEPKGYLLVVRDITDQLKIERELIRASKLESVGLLAGGIAHDFNNILTGVITGIFIAKMNVREMPETLQILTETEKAAFRASRLTKQLLTFSKGGAPVKELTSLIDVLEDAVGFSLSGSSVDCRLEISPDLSAVEIDKGQIDQVINNLIINADQAMPSGGTLVITAENVTLTSNAVHPLPEGDYVCVTVADTGIGIPQENLSRIFDPYFTTKGSGTGLGLTTAYAIIRKHEGQMTVESTPGNGTIFAFYLPASKTPSAPATAVLQEAATGTGRVLVMDDDEIVRSVMARLLSASGYDVVSVDDGAAALEVYADAQKNGRRFNVVIMDLTISGGKGGKETIVDLLRMDPAACAIVVSGYSNDPVLANYRDYGFKGVISKPFNVGEFTRTVQSIIDAG